MIVRGDRQKTNKFVIDIDGKTKVRKLVRSLAVNFEKDPIEISIIVIFTHLSQI